MDLELRTHFSVLVVKSLNFICDLALVQERHHGPWSHLPGCDVVSWLKGWNGSGYGQAFLLSLKLQEGSLGCHVGTVYGRGADGAIYSQGIIPSLQALLGSALSTPGFNAPAMGSYF